LLIIHDDVIKKPLELSCGRNLGKFVGMG
jgi:hypothetical protein